MPNTIYTTNSTELTSIASAIRTAGGTSSTLEYPNGFVAAINNINGGGGSLITQTVDGQLDKTVGEIYEAFIAGQAVILKLNPSESDLYIGDYGILENIRIFSDEAWNAEIRFNGGYFYAHSVSTREELFAEYPMISD